MDGAMIEFGHQPAPLCRPRSSGWAVVCDDGADERRRAGALWRTSLMQCGGVPPGLPAAGLRACVCDEL